MLELLVAGLCIGGFKCDQASKAYFVYNPQPQVWVMREADKAHTLAASYVGEQMLVAAATVGAAATQKTYQIKISKHFSFGKTDNGLELRYGFSF